MYQFRQPLIKEQSRNAPRSSSLREQVPPWMEGPHLQETTLQRPTSSLTKAPHIRSHLLVRVGLFLLVFLVCLGIFISLVQFSPLASLLGGSQTQATPIGHSSTSSIFQVVQRPSEVNDQMRAMGQEKIHAFESALGHIQRTSKDVAHYQAQLQHYRTQLAALSTRRDYIAFLIQIGSDLASMQQDLADNQPQPMLNQFKTEAQDWGKAHLYHDPFDKKDYYLNSSYLSMDGHNGYFYGESAYLNDEIRANSPQVMQDIKDDYFLHAMLEANYEDTTSYNQPHQVDQNLLAYYSLQNADVLLVSLTEQSMRIYHDGTLKQSLLLTTGRVYRPTPVGHFHMSTHYENLTLTSYDAPSSPDYYTPVVVRDAVQFWDNGYLIHSSQWRKDYGPMTQFPHNDSGGDPEASVGSHGCINVAPSILRTLAPTITTQTHLIIF